MTKSGYFPFVLPQAVRRCWTSIYFRRKKYFYFAWFFKKIFNWPKGTQ